MGVLVSASRRNNLFRPSFHPFNFSMLQHFNSSISHYSSPCSPSDELAVASSLPPAPLLPASIFDLPSSISPAHRKRRRIPAPFHPHPMDSAPRSPADSAHAYKSSSYSHPYPQAA